jgi:aspartyl/glutamyl-tRNA(Asn/Gln) amidotransferase C subunit
MEKQTLEKLADLARLNIQPEEYAELETQINGIISLVDTVQHVSIEKKDSVVGAQINVARADAVMSSRCLKFYNFYDTNKTYNYRASCKTR